MEHAISVVDPSDDRVIDEIIEVLAASNAVETPDLPPPCRQHLVGTLRFPRKAFEQKAFIARDGATLTGYLQVFLPRSDNPENSDLELTVHPAYRRRGVGRALLGHVTEFLRADGRLRTVGNTYKPLDSDGQDEPGVAFATAVGAKPALTEVRRRLVVSTVDEAALDGLLADAWTKADGYRSVQWVGVVPDEYLDGVAYLDSRMSTDVPLGDIKWEPETIDHERIREREAQMEVRQTRLYTTIVVHEASGDVVAQSAIGFDHASPENGWQYNTIVEPAHRGHRLGTIVKIDNYRLVMRHEPQVRTINTWNAAVNDHMIAINEAMGFRPVDAWVAWQLEL